MRIGITGVLCIALFGLSWGIATEGRSPHERPDWWKQYDNTPAIQVSPDIIAPKGDTPSVVEESVTRNAPVGVPETLVVSSEGAKQGTNGITPSIEGTQVIQEASRDLDAGRHSLWRGFALFGLFLVVGGGAVFGVIRWLSNQLPEPPKPTRRRRF